jgi:hypothetical protein
VLRRLWHHLARMRWWERAIAALYLAFAVQEVGQGNVPAALVAVAISALFLVTPFVIFKGLPLARQLGIVILGCGLMVMFLKLG